LRANLSVSYHNFSSRFNKSLNSVTEPDFLKYDVYSGIIGIENNFTPMFKFKPYVGIGIIGSIIEGNGKVTRENEQNNVKVLPAFRLGLSLSSGLEYMFTNKLGFNCGVRFTHANIWLKESKVSENPNETYLNDSRTISEIPFAGFKQFAWGSFFAGMNYYLGIKEKTYIYTK
jgi:hypothetical protein